MVGVGGRELLEEALQHGCSVGGPGLVALDGAAQVLDPPTAVPDVLKLPGQDLRPPLPGQARLLQAQFTHLHVIFPCTQQAISGTGAAAGEMTSAGPTRRTSPSQLSQSLDSENTQV